ncbi:MAG: cell division protein, partial [Rhodospirillaceae bacterium]
MIGHVTDVPLRNDPASRFLPWMVGLQVFLATLALAAAMLMATVGDTWRDSLSGTLTVQVPPLVDDSPDSPPSADAPADDARVVAALDLLRETSGVESARRIPDSQIGEMLEPWLGSTAFGIDLPMAALIDVSVASGATVDVEALA